MVETSAIWRPWLAGLPASLRFTLDLRAGESPFAAQGCAGYGAEAPPARRVLCCHGSPRKINEFLWESTTPTHLLEKFCDDHHADLIIATHTGLPWSRSLSRQRLFVNCGAIGRPANNGSTEVVYCILDAADPRVVSFIPLQYDHESLAHEMQAESLPQPFIDTILTGWWTTCLEILPAKERARGKC